MPAPQLAFLQRGAIEVEELSYRRHTKPSTVSMTSDSTLLDNNKSLGASRRTSASKESGHPTESVEYLALQKENEILRGEVSVLRAALHTFEQKGEEKALFEKLQCAKANVVSPDHHHTKGDSTLEQSDERDDNSSVCGIKHRRSPVQPQRRVCDASLFLTSKEFYPIDVDMEFAPLNPIDTILPLSSTGQHEQSNSPTFLASVRDRASWLVGLLILQSMSSFIISRNESLLQRHLVIVQFLTMLVGAGASVHVIRGLATGGIGCWKGAMRRELGMGLALAAVLGVAGAIRASIFATPALETLAITTSLVLIVFLSVLLGAGLPLVMQMCGIDPAHSSTTIQVLMDILGVTITVQVCSLVLDSTVFAAVGY